MEVPLDPEKRDSFCNIFYNLPQSIHKQHIDLLFSILQRSYNAFYKEKLNKISTKKLNLGQYAAIKIELRILNNHIFLLKQLKNLRFQRSTVININKNIRRHHSLVTYLKCFNNTATNCLLDKLLPLRTLFPIKMLQISSLLRYLTYLTDLFQSLERTTDKVEVKQ